MRSFADIFNGTEKDKENIRKTAAKLNEGLKLHGKVMEVSGAEDLANFAVGTI